MELRWLVQMLITNHHQTSANTQSSNTNVQAVSAPTSESRSYSTSTTSYSAPSHNYSSHSSSVRLSNGNTAGSVGSYAAAQMAARTGVSASTWEHIIARESNGQLHA